MPIWWRMVVLPASIETLVSAHRETAQGTVADAAHVNLDQWQLFVLYISSVVVGGLSLVSTLVAIASFLRMRRSFRHDLILLLILSDMFKTLWLVILPATELVRGAVATTSSLCQISGYFLSVGIVACDIAVLLMATHTGLYIFRGRTGLYPYRFSAYAMVTIVSLTLASLAFINKPAFVNSGPYCYLPSQPGWTRRALSWIPRYVIVSTIMLTYTCVYTYVRWVMTKSEKPGRLRKGNEPRLSDARHVQASRFLPQTPPIAYHGLIPPTPPCDQVMSDKTLVLTSRLTPPRPSQNTSVRESSLVRQSNERPEHSFTSLPLLNSSPSGILNNDKHGETSDGSIPPSLRFAQERLVSTARPTTVTAQRRISQKSNSLADNMLKEQSGLILDDQCPGNSRNEIALPQLILSPTTLNATGMPRVRDKIRRQLGQLFVYPLVYMTGWLIPFISHIVGGEETGRPFWLILASLISLCIQGIADSVVYLMMEKPWRYWTREDVTAWCFLWSRQSSMKGNGTKVGRTREEMLIDGTIARRRKEREQAEWRLRSAGCGPKYTDWWDLTLIGIDKSGDEDGLGWKI